MYRVSDEFKNAIESTSRLMNCKAYLNDVEISVDKILKLDIEDNINNGDYFTIGEVPAKSLVIELIGVQDVVEGAEIKPYYGVEVDSGKFEYVPCGVYYVDSVSTNKDKVSATCYDKMLSLDDEYVPNIAIPVTLSEIMNDICQQKGIEFEGELPNITINKPIKGYSYREMVGFLASFCGGNAKFNRVGKLTIQKYTKSTKVINPNVCAKFEEKEIYTVSAIVCKFGDVANTRGDSSANCVNFTNPFVDDTNIDSIFNLLNGLTFTAASFKYKGDPSVDSGDLITINDVKGNSHVVLVSTQDFKFSGGLTSEITSIGEGKGANAYKQYKFKNKKSITELNVELGLIQGIISEVQEKQEDTYTKTETETLIEAKAGEISLSVAKKEVDSAKAEIDKTLENYPTTTEMNSVIIQKANEITSTVEVTKTSGVEMIPQTYMVNSTSGFNTTRGTVQVNKYGLYSREQSWIRSALLAVDRTKPIYCSYDFTTVGTGATYIGFEQYDADGNEIGTNASTIYWVSTGEHTGWKTGEYILSANQLNSETRYVKLRILTNWNANSAFQYTQFKKLSALQLQSRTTSTQIAQMSDKIESKVDVNGVKSTITQSAEEVKVAFNKVSSSVVQILTDGLAITHSDGSYSWFRASGSTHYIAGSHRKYHSLMVAGTVSATDSWGQISITITLPSEFKGKSFNVLPSLVHVGFDRGVAHAFKNLNISTHDFDYTNGKFSLTCSPIGVDVTGAYTVNASTVRVSYIAIA
ncbi:hypothetical protein [Turicibacter sanguinis]|uniref:hypothetical protein n=1 Tax=Turicibacter sanguinis TaxID=154288 RepID=UPI0018AB020D|nr:hypothetical protein [Turicibacter sanguinis]MDB8553247.1 hypothetical protein [Turicibacter sanguinis]